jgi:hypothetical protein
MGADKAEKLPELVIAKESKLKGCYAGQGNPFDPLSPRAREKQKINRKGRKERKGGRESP